MLLTRLPPENYRLLPPLAAPAGYICLIRDMEYGDQYCLHLAYDPSGIDDTLNSVAFEVRLARIFGVEGDAASAKAELLQRFNSEDEWFTLRPDQLRDLDRLARPARRRSDETPPNPRPRPERSQQNPRPRPERSQQNPRPRPPEISQRNPSQRRVPLNLILIALILLVIGALAEEANGTISGIMERLAASAAIPTASPSNTPMPSATDAPSKTPAPSATATATDAPSNTPMPSATATATDAPSKTPAPSSTATATDAPSKTPAPSATATDAPSKTPAPSATATDAPSNTPAPTDTATATDAPSKTPMPSATATATDAPSKTPMPSATATATPSDVPPPIYVIETVQNVNANIRACPRTSCGLVGKLAAGAEVEVTGTVSGETVYGSDVWLQINFKDGSAYLHSELAEKAN